MNKEVRKFLKKKKFVIGVPTVVKFLRSNKKDFAKFKATKGTEVMKYSDVLKLLKIAEKKGEKKC